MSDKSAIAVIPWEAGMKAVGFYSTFPPNNPKATIAAINDSEPLEGFLNKTIVVVHVVMHSVALPDPQTGELKDQTRIVLVTKDGKNLASISKGVLQSLKFVAALDSPPPWLEGMAFKVQQSPAKKGRVFKLIPV
jgi:hypothetical protein